LKIKGLEENDLDRGFVACNIDNLCHITQEILVKLSVLELPEHK